MPLIFFTYPKKATTAGKWELLLADTLMEHVSVVETSAVDFSGYLLSARSWAITEGLCI